MSGQNREVPPSGEHGGTGKCQSGGASDGQEDKPNGGENQDSSGDFDFESLEAGLLNGKGDVERNRLESAIANGGGEPPAAKDEDGPEPPVACENQLAAVEDNDTAAIVGTVSWSPYGLLLEYIRRGWNPVKVPCKEKNPNRKKWQARPKVTLANVKDTFPGPDAHACNIGVQFGPMSNYLVDVDLDCPEALLVAPHFFEPTDTVFGRAGKQKSHYLYYSRELIETVEHAGVQFIDPERQTGKMLLELRIGGGGKGSQTVFPGGVHSSGESIEWSQFGEPSTMTSERLLWPAKLTAAACLMVRDFPADGAKHDAALVIGGFLARLGWTAEQAEYFLQTVLRAAGADVAAARCAAPAVEKWQSGDQALPGFPRLAEIFGDKHAKSIAKWLGYKDAGKEKKAALAVRCMEEMFERQQGSNALAENFTDLGNARRLVHRYADDIRYCHAFKSWFMWDDDYWRRDDNGEINRRAEQTIEALLQEALEMDKKDPMRDMQIAFALRSEERGKLDAMVAIARNDYRAVLDYKKLDAGPLLVGVLNGVIDLRTGEFWRGRREDFITMRCSIAYDPEAKCPNWQEFQEKIAGGHKGLVTYKRRAFGILLSGEVPEILWIAHGDGANGKTTELETISDILGDYSQAADASLLITGKERGGPTPEVVVLRGKRAVFINETEAKDWLNEQRVKYLAGTDEMAGRGLYENQINWKPTHKPWLRTNHKPKIRGNDLGIWRRIHYIPYITTISEDEAIKNYREKMLVPEHAGIFNWMLAGWKEYLANERKLMPPPCVQESTAAYRKEMDHTGRWLEVGVEPFAEGKAFLKSIYVIYREWFKNEVGDYGAVSIQKLADCLEAEGYRKGRGHAGATFFEGLSLKVFGESLMTAEQIDTFVAGVRERQDRINDNR